MVTRRDIIKTIGALSILPATTLAAPRFKVGDRVVLNRPNRISLLLKKSDLCGNIVQIDETCLGVKYDLWDEPIWTCANWLKLTQPGYATNLDIEGRISSNEFRGYPPYTIKSLGCYRSTAEGGGLLDKKSHNFEMRMKGAQFAWHTSGFGIDFSQIRFDFSNDVSRYPLWSIVNV